MNESEKELTNEESLKLISRTILEAKGYFHESGIGTLLWGFSILICSLLTFAVGENIISFPFPPFYLLVPVFLVQARVQMKENKMKKAKLLPTKPSTLYGQVTFYPQLPLFLQILPVLHTWR